MMSYAHKIYDRQTTMKLHVSIVRQFKRDRVLRGPEEYILLYKNEVCKSIEDQNRLNLRITQGSSVNIDAICFVLSCSCFDLS